MLRQHRNFGTVHESEVVKFGGWRRDSVSGDKPDSVLILDAVVIHTAIFLLLGGFACELGLKAWLVL